MIKNRFATIILAAGKGTRMKSLLAKVMHPVLGKPMLYYSVACARQTGSDPIVVVVGHQAETVKEAMINSGVLFAEQREQLGTGHAVLVTRNHFDHFKGTVLILCGDVPLLKLETIHELQTRHLSEGATLTVMTTILENPKGYGRIIKGADGNILKIVEERDATPDEKDVKEINTGIYCVEAEFLFAAVERIENHNAQREYYLTDIVGIAVESGKKAMAFIAPDSNEVMGINTVEELQRAEEEMKRRVKSDSL
jgi:UDP-N-acetylglucosamine diphosphorylase/glucosamine-1-phosphate N-acetyltransferase